MKILYCSSTEQGERLLEWLRNLECEIIGAYTSNQDIGEYPEDYDLGVSFMYTHRIPASQVNGHRWINFHPGPLPEMRGRNLAYYAIQYSMLEFGATLHYMSETFDTGPIIECRRFPIAQEYTAGDLVSLAHQAAADMFREYLPRFVSGEDVPAQEQALSDGVYFSKTPIVDRVYITPAQARVIRALTVAPRYYARIEIGGRSYRIVPEVEP